MRFECVLEKKRYQYDILLVTLEYVPGGVFFYTRHYSNILKLIKGMVIRK